MKSLLIFLMFIFPVHAALPTILGSNLIDQTCKQTPYYDLCIWSLISNPYSFDTDVKGLAKIMVHNIDAKATHALHRIDELLHSGRDQKTQNALKSCAERYNIVIKGDVPQALASLHNGDYKFAEDGTYDAAFEAMSCEEGFSGKSPLSDMNMIVHDISIVAASIVKIIISH